jgi:hypothetical protein
MLGKVAGYPSRADTLKLKRREEEKGGIEGKGFLRAEAIKE